MPGDVAAACVAMARRHPLHRPSVHYPDWYLHRWHLLPEGYLSSRSVHLYDRYIRRLYWAGGESGVTRRLVAELKNSAAGSLLELGCGPGRTLAALARGLPGWKVDGVDLSPFMVEAARRRASAAEVHHGDALALPFDNGSRDMILAAHLVFHLPAREAQVAVLHEAFRLLRPGGAVILIEHAWHAPPPGPWRETQRSTAAVGLLRVTWLERERPGSVTAPAS